MIFGPKPGPAIWALALAFAGCGSGADEPRAPQTEPEPPPLADPSPLAAPSPAPTPPAPVGQRGPWTQELVLEHAAYDEPGAPSAIVHAPPSFDPAKPLRLAIFLHGYRGCARVLAYTGPTRCKERGRSAPREGWGLIERFDDADSDALFIIPQLAFVRRSGHPGRFGDEGGFRAFLDELLAALGPRLAGDDVARVTLLAHSAGFEATLAILARGGVDIRDVVLFDALYAGVAPFSAWVRADADRRLVSLYTGGGSTARQSRRLFRHLRAALGDALAYDRDAPLPAQLADTRVVIARSRAPHASVPARHLAAVLAGIGLSTRE